MMKKIGIPLALWVSLLWTKEASADSARNQQGQEQSIILAQSPVNQRLQWLWIKDPTWRLKVEKAETIDFNQVRSRIKEINAKISWPMDMSQDPMMVRKDLWNELADILVQLNKVLHFGLDNPYTPVSIVDWNIVVEHWDWSSYDPYHPELAPDTIHYTTTITPDLNVSQSIVNTSTWQNIPLEVAKKWMHIADSAVDMSHMTYKDRVLINGKREQEMIRILKEAGLYWWKWVTLWWEPVK